MTGAGHLVNRQLCCLEEDEQITSWVYAQPCVGSDAETGWNQGCYPYFDACYVEQITAEATTTVYFAFLGACWFLDGEEDLVEEEDLNEDGTAPEYGFNIGTIENGDGAVYDNCSDCLNDDLNERWMKFVLCGDWEYQKCPTGDDDLTCYLCEDYVDTTIYIPMRFIIGIGEGNSCRDHFDDFDMDERCKAEGLCRTFQDYRSQVADRTVEPQHDWCWCAYKHKGCCYKSCDENAESVIVGGMPTPCVGGVCCCDIWTPKWKHDIDGGNVDCASTFGDQPVEQHNGDPPYMWQGCCSCTTNHDQPSYDTELCRVFEGMSSWSYTFTLWPENVCCPYGEDTAPNSLGKTYCCQFDPQSVTLNFTVHPEDAHNGYYSYDPILDKYHCVILNEGTGGACYDAEGVKHEYSCCEGNCSEMSGCYGWCKAIGVSGESNCSSLCDSDVNWDICDPCDWCANDCGAPCAGESCYCGGGGAVVLRHKCGFGCYGWECMDKERCAHFCWDWNVLCRDENSGAITGAILGIGIVPYTGSSRCSRPCCSGECGADGVNCTACAAGACQSGRCSIFTSNYKDGNCHPYSDCYYGLVTQNKICFPMPDPLGDGGECLNDGCPLGEIRDCNDNCCPASWVGDGYCDDGAYTWGNVPIYLNCEEFDFDGGDCYGGP